MNNRVELIGVMGETKRVKGKYTSTLQVKRDSGVVDDIPLLIPKGYILPQGTRACVKGTLKAHLLRCGKIYRRVLYVRVTSAVAVSPGPDINKVVLSGVVCNNPQVISTPFHSFVGVPLAVSSNRLYIPCVAFDGLARSAALLSEGDEIYISGRIHSESGSYTVHIYDRGQHYC